MLLHDEIKLAVILSLTFCFLTVASGILAVLEGTEVFKSNSSLILKSTDCFVLESIDYGTSTCACDSVGSDDNNSCRGLFPCVRVTVQYNAKNGSITTTINSTLMDIQTIEIMEDGKHDNVCSITPVCSEDTSKNNQSVHEYLRKFGIVGTEFLCYYNPSKIEKVQAWVHSPILFTGARIFYFILIMLLFLPSIFVTLFIFKWLAGLIMQACQKKEAVGPVDSCKVADETFKFQEKSKSFLTTDSYIPEL